MSCFGISHTPNKQAFCRFFSQLIPLEQGWSRWTCAQHSTRVASPTAFSHVFLSLCFIRRFCVVVFDPEKREIEKERKKNFNEDEEKSFLIFSLLLRNKEK
jgi:hypothetical protein